MNTLGNDFVGQINTQIARVQNPLVLINMMIDDSSSMSFYKNFYKVIEGHNNLIDILAQSPRASVFQVRSQYMHGRVISNGYRPIQKAARLTSKNYKLHGGTPLFLACRRTLHYSFRKFDEFTKQGYDVYTLNFLFTDGDNRHKPAGITAQNVKCVTEQMNKSGRHIIVGVVANCGYVDFRKVFLEMGVLPQWIVSITSPDDVKQTFTDFASVAEKSSCGSESFMQTLADGFETTIGCAPKNNK